MSLRDHLETRGSDPWGKAAEPLGTPDSVSSSSVSRFAVTGEPAEDDRPRGAAEQQRLPAVSIAPDPNRRREEESETGSEGAAGPHEPLTQP